MKKLLSIVFTLISIGAFAQISVSKTDGSSVVTNYGMSSMNDGSSLIRKKINLNDSTCPIQINDVEIYPTYFSESFYFKHRGSISISEPIVAYELNFVLYDVFGEHITSLSSTHISDLEGNFELPKSSRWYADNNDVQEYFICVSYVAFVRTKSGRLWKYNYDAIKEKLAEQEIAFEENFLPKTDPKK